jgi:hypothetical protein
VHWAQEQAFHTMGFWRKLRTNYSK